MRRDNVCGNRVSWEERTCHLSPPSLYPDVPHLPAVLVAALGPDFLPMTPWAVHRGYHRLDATIRSTGQRVRLRAARCTMHSTQAFALAREIAVLRCLALQPSAEPLLAAGRTGGWVFVVTPCCTAGSLSARMTAGAPLTVETALTYVIAIADLLHFSHSLGIVHGAISAEAICVHGDGVVLTGFDSAQFVATDSRGAAAVWRDVKALATVLATVLGGDGELSDGVAAVAAQSREGAFITAIDFAQALCEARDTLTCGHPEVSAREAGTASERVAPLGDVAERSLRVLHALLDQAEIADLPPEPEDPLVQRCWRCAEERVAAGDARLIALRCRWNLLAERDPVRALSAARAAPDAADVLPYRARALAAMGRAGEARTLATRVWFQGPPLDAAAVRSLTIAFVLTRAFALVSRVSDAEGALGAVVDPVIAAAAKLAAAGGIATPLSEVSRWEALRAIEAALDRRSVWTAQLLVDPRWDALRGDQRFAELALRSRAQWANDEGGIAQPG
jgi:hypothetical protein